METVSRMVREGYSAGDLSKTFTAIAFCYIDQSDIRDVTNNTGELCAVIACNACSIDDPVIDLRFVRTVNQPKVDRLVDLPSLHLSFDHSKDILPKLAQEYHLFFGMFGDAAHKLVSKKLHKKVNELLLAPMGKRGQEVPVHVPPCPRNPQDV